MHNVEQVANTLLRCFIMPWFFLVGDGNAQVRLVHDKYKLINRNN
jgi:hypothetical protein